VASTRSSLQEGLDSGEYEYTHKVATVTASGPTTIYTPATGKLLRLRWIYAVSDPGSTSPLIRVFLGGTASKYEIFRVYALSKRQTISGPIDGPLIVDLSVAGSVAVTAILEEV
jgi:hypothetical protein